jgi:hypothetical protein
MAAPMATMLLMPAKASTTTRRTAPSSFGLIFVSFADHMAVSADDPFWRAIVGQWVE